MRNRNKIANSSNSGALLILIVIIGFFYGWVANIVTILGMEEVLNGEGIIRIIGVFIAPLGAIMGYV